ncbi:nucleotide exchange factor GrpE [Patescibacteria group bacterium]|nr:nucleotide exchange factor GrpE [Patescibacteria group bacterium]
MLEKNNQNQNNQKYPEPVVGPIIYNEKNEILLVRFYKWGEFWVIPGGHIELGETSKEALKREIKEETNLEIDNIEFLGWQDAIYPKYFFKKKHFIALNFCARMAGGEITKSDEMEEWIWIEPEKALKTLKIEPLTIKAVQFYLKHKENKEKNYEDKYKRALADYQNLLKQTVNEKQEFIKYVNKNLIQEILPVYDNLKLAMKHAEIAETEVELLSVSTDRSSTSVSANNITEGIKHIIKQFKDILESAGVEEIKTVGEKFDHHTMEAVEGKGERVVREVKAGYKLHGKVVAVAKVILE